MGICLTFVRQLPDALHLDVSFISAKPAALDNMDESEYAPKFAPFIGMAGIASAMIFGCLGAAYGTAKSGIGIAGVGTFRPDLIMKCLIPVIMSGILAVYSLVISVLIAEEVNGVGGKTDQLDTSLGELGFQFCESSKLSGAHWCEIFWMNTIAVAGTAITIPVPALLPEI